MSTKVLPSNQLTSMRGKSLSPTKQIPMKNAHSTKLLWKIQNKENYQPKLFHPYDVTFLWDGRVALVEGFYPYSRIQVLDDAGRSNSSIAQGDIMPYGITSDPEGYLAITDHKDRTVKFYTPDGKSAISWKTNMFDWPDGIASTKSGHYMITDWAKGTASLHDIDGVQITSFSTADTKNLEVKSCPAYVTIDKHQRVILTDTFDHTVKVFNMCGQFLFKFGNTLNQNHFKISDPRGVTTDSQGNIIVAEWQGNRVSQFSPDGQFIQYLLNDMDVKYPWGVTMNSQGKICVSEQKLNAKPALKMFQVQTV